MNKFLVLSFAALISVGCNSAAQKATTANTNAVADNSIVQSSNNPHVQPTNDSAIVSSHSDGAEKTVAPSENISSTESPQARPIDVAKMTADIEKAEKEVKKNPAAKEELAKAYFVRATALTEAAQYRAALGDYRRGLKLNPNDESAKLMHDEILRIFQSMKRQPPKEGEEPKPLPVK